MNIFHRHTFDPEKWVRIDTVRLFDREDNTTVEMREVYKNTCLTCGDIVFKRVKL